MLAPSTVNTRSAPVDQPTPPAAPRNEYGLTADRCSKICRVDTSYYDADHEPDSERKDSQHERELDVAGGREQPPAREGPPSSEEEESRRDYNPDGYERWQGSCEGVYDRERVVVEAAVEWSADDLGAVSESPLHPADFQSQMTPLEHDRTN